MEHKTRPVDVICVCSADGEIRPLRLRLENEKDRELRFEIREILGVEQNLRFGAESITFLCSGKTDIHSYFLELRYSVRTHSWCMIRCFQK